MRRTGVILAAQRALSVQLVARPCHAWVHDCSSSCFVLLLLLHNGLAMGKLWVLIATNPLNQYRSHLEPHRRAAQLRWPQRNPCLWHAIRASHRRV